jgi:hypothetical protein
VDSEVFTDPYVYPGTPVLKNKLGLKDPARFKEAEVPSHMDKERGDGRRTHKRLL